MATGGIVSKPDPTVKGLAVDSGGYDYEFVSDVPDSLVCLICTFPARDPQQISCCGRVFCKTCMRKTEKFGSCPNCRKKDMIYFPDIKSDREIKSFKVKCTNIKSSCSWSGEISELSKHLKKCLGVLVCCKYAGIGCKATLLEKDMPAHNQEAQTDHLGMAVDLISNLRRRIDLLEVRSCSVFPPVRPTTTDNSPKIIPPVIFKHECLDYYRCEGEEWTSLPFYSSTCGYKMCLTVQIEVKALLVYVKLMRGEFDDDLEWPFRGEVHYKLLNQKEDKDHIRGEAICEASHTNTKNARVPADKEVSSAGWGGIFAVGLPWECFNYDGVNVYGLEDSAYFRVLDIKVYNHNKPWLECAIPL